MPIEQLLPMVCSHVTRSLITKSFFFDQFDGELVLPFLMSIDSGLSLTTARDATEADSDHEVKLNKEFPSADIKQLRPLITKKEKDDTDSDEVFPEV